MTCPPDLADSVRHHCHTGYLDEPLPELTAFREGLPELHILFDAAPSTKRSPPVACRGAPRTGRRTALAAQLVISERSLYRKLKSVE